MIVSFTMYICTCTIMVCDVIDITMISMILYTCTCTILGDNVSSEGDDDVQTGSEKLQIKQKDDDTCKPQVKFTKRKNVTSTR